MEWETPPPEGIWCILVETETRSPILPRHASFGENEARTKFPVNALNKTDAQTCVICCSEPHCVALHRRIRPGSGAVRQNRFFEFGYCALSQELGRSPFHVVGISHI